MPFGKTRERASLRPAVSFGISTAPLSHADVVSTVRGSSKGGFCPKFVHGVSAGCSSTCDRCDCRSQSYAGRFATARQLKTTTSVFQLRQGTEQALPALTVMTNEDTVCWQCDAAADPGCAHSQTLVNRSQYADGLGVPVKRSAWGRNVVKVTVPRCKACQFRNYLWAFLSFAGFFVGACIGGLQFPSRGITTIIGGFVGLTPRAPC